MLTFLGIFLERRQMYHNIMVFFSVHMINFFSWYGYNLRFISFNLSDHNGLLSRCNILSSTDSSLLKFLSFKLLFMWRRRVSGISWIHIFPSLQNGRHWGKINFWVLLGLTGRGWLFSAYTNISWVIICCPQANKLYCVLAGSVKYELKNLISFYIEG